MNLLKFHTDSSLLVPVTASAVNHLIDGSTDPVDLIFYLGSDDATKKFENSTDPGINDLSISIRNATELWEASTAKVVNDTVRTTAKNGYKYKVQSITGPGLTSASEPAWPTAVGDIIVDNEVTWVNDDKLHESTEIKLALTLIGLDSAVAGDPLTLPSTINGGSSNAVVVYVRIDDATAIISNESELNLFIVGVQESVI